MKNHVFKTELSRAFTGWGFLLSVFIALIIAGAEFFLVTVTGMENPYEVFPDGDFGVPHNLWNLWLGGEMVSIPSYVYRLLLPVLAALPFASSYATDMNGGYVGQLLIRADKRRYLISKITSVWLSGGISVIMPLLFSFLLATAVLPLRGPNRTDAFVIGSNQLFGELYPQSPVAYEIVFGLMMIIFGGLIAFIALYASLYVKNTFLILVSPFALLLSFEVLVDMLIPPMATMYVPMDFLHPSQWSYTTYPILFMEIFVLLAFGVGFYLIAYKRDVI